MLFRSRGNSDVVDLLLVAVKPEYQSKGVNALIFTELIPRYIANGSKFAESNVELEGNGNVQKQWGKKKYLFCTYSMLFEHFKVLLFET